MKQQPMNILTKKGYFYTLSVMFFLGLFFAVFLTATNLTGNNGAQEIKIRAMDDFLTDLENDLDRAAYISGFRALIALEEHVSSTGTYLTNMSGSFEQAFLNGTIENASYEILENSTFEDYLLKTQTESASIGMIIDLGVTNVTLYHLSPWEIAVDYALTIHLNDTSSMTRWSYEKQFSTAIEIYDLRDPLYSVETNNKVPNTLRVYNNFVEFVDDAGDANDTTTLTSFLENSYYSYSPLAPSFLMRFQGNNSPSEFGIESLINLDELDAQGIVVDTDRSVVDYLYFSSDNSADQCSIQNMDSYFKIDDEHLNFYEITTELTYSACP